jgi:hypothetical protein
MANDTLLNTPTLWVNKYLESKIPDLTGLSDIPFFPTLPSTIDDLTETFPSADVMATYDRMIRMNRKSFPHIKTEQVLYYFYAVGSEPIPKVVQATEAIFRLLDRFDESAEEVNNWCSNRRVNLGTPQLPNLIDNIFYFHNFRVYQLEEARDIIDFGTARTYAGNKIIVEFEYHQKPVVGSDGKDSVMYSDWTPEARLSGDDKISI